MRWPESSVAHIFHELFLLILKQPTNFKILYLITRRRIVIVQIATISQFSHNPNFTEIALTQYSEPHTSSNNTHISQSKFSIW